MDTNNANGFPAAAERRNGIYSNTCDEVTLKLSGLIGVFDLMVDIATKDPSRGNANETMSNFAYYISSELQSLYKTVCGVDYRE